MKPQGSPTQSALKGAAFFVLHKEAGVFYYQEAGCVGFGGGLLVLDSLLEPKGSGVDGDGGIGDRGNFFGAAEDVDDVDGFWDVFKTSIRFLAKNFGFVGIDGDDFITNGLKVGRDFVGGAAWIGGESDDGDGFGMAEEIGDGVGEIGSVVREMEDHCDSMMETEKRIKEIGRK